MNPPDSRPDLERLLHDLWPADRPSGEASGVAPLDELLLRWEEARAAGSPLTAEELCRDCPELLDEVYRPRVILTDLTAADPLLSLC